MKTRREASAGGVVSRDGAEGREVLLAARRNRRGELVWGLPKGLVEHGEATEAAALREVREETGFDARIVASLGEITYWYVWDEVRVHKTVTFFLMEAMGGDPSRRDHEMEEISWFPLEQAPRAAAYRSEREILERAARQSARQG